MAYTTTSSVISSNDNIRTWDQIKASLIDPKHQARVSIANAQCAAKMIDWTTYLGLTGNKTERQTQLAAIRAVPQDRDAVTDKLIHATVKSTQSFAAYTRPDYAKHIMTQTEHSLRSEMLGTRAVLSRWVGENYVNG